MADLSVKVTVQKFGDDAVQVEVEVGTPVGAVVEKAGYSVRDGEIRKDNLPVSAETPIEQDSTVTMVPPMHGG